MEDLVGRKVKGYELRERIGAGGFGAVYRGYQSTVGREVAIKIILPGYTNHPDFIRRFEAEAQLVARLEHLHIAPLYDYWRDPEGAFLVMRYLRGGNLSDALKRGHYDLESAALLLDQISSALSLAHSNNIIHRDIKPENILLDEDGNAYLADFGIAKDVRLQAASSTQKDAIMGSPDYIAPEQARSEPVTPRTDVYSLGIVLYEMLTGEHPFPNLTPVERLFKHLNDPVPRITTVETEVSEAIDRVVQKATAKDPEKRYSDVRSFAASFREAAGLRVSQAVRGLVELLTPREQEVLRLMIDGKSNREIAEQLVIEVTTVKWYSRQIYRKLSVRSRVQAIVKARELNLIVDDRDLKGAGTTSLIALPEPENPYRGLRAFQIADERYFFGRENLTKELLLKLGEQGEFSRFLAVVGPSGSGKSSLVKAGLIPALWRGELPGSERWFVVDMVPGAHPLDELEVALMRIAAQQSGSLMEQLERDARGLLRVAQLILPDDGSELVIVMDQFEELFTLVEAEGERAHVLSLIRNAVTEPRSRVRIVITLRADFYDRPLLYPDFGALVQRRTQTVLPLSAEELERAILRPAEAVGVKYEEGLAVSIAQEVHYQPGALPLMQYALTELFERREDHTLTHAAYQAMGGSIGALAKRIEDIFTELDREGQEAVRQMFLRLVTLGEGAEDTRRRVPRSELLAISAHPDLIDELIDTYTASRLLSLDHDPATRSPTVELAHEAILREWDRLRGWLDESRADIRLQRSLASAAKEWGNAGRDRSYLLRGVRLTQYEQWAHETDLALTETEHEFLQASVEHRQRDEEGEAARQQREKALERRARRVLQGLVGVFLVAALTSGVLAISANVQRERAEAAEQEALEQASIGLAAQAIAELDSDTPDRGVLLALEALDNYPYTPQAERALAQTVYATRPYLELTGYQDANQAAAFSPDGTRVATVGGQHDAVIWDVSEAADPTAMGPEYLTAAEWVGHVDVAWSPDSLRLVTVTARTEFASKDVGLIKVWDLATGENLSTWTGHAGNSIWAVAWSENGQFIITGGGDSLARQWDASTFEEVRAFSGHTGAVRDVVLSPGGARLATASEDGTLRIWEMGSGETTQVLSGHLGAVNAVDWSSDGSRLVSAGNDGLIVIWDVDAGEISQILKGHTDAVQEVAWSPDGLIIASSSADGTTRIWDAPSGSVISTLQGGKMSSMSPDGERLINGFGAFGIRIWDLSGLPLRLLGHQAAVTDAALTPDGSRIVTSSFDGTVRVWDPDTGETLLIFDDHIVEGASGPIPMPSIAPDSEWVATTGRDNQVRVWNVRSGEERQEFPFRAMPLFSPDGSKLALIGEERAIIMDWKTGEFMLDFDPGFPGFCFILRMAWSPDGRFLMVPCGVQHQVDIWDTQTGERVKVLTHAAEVSPAGWSSDGSRLLTADSTGVVHVWDAQTFELIYDFKGHTSSIYDAEFSPNGRRIASGDDSGMVRIWDVETGQEVNSYNVGFGVLEVDWSPNGSQLFTSGFDPIPDIRQAWQTTEDLIAYAKECCVFRELTPEERTQFGLAP